MKNIYVDYFLKHKAKSTTESYIVDDLCVVGSDVILDELLVYVGRHPTTQLNHVLVHLEYWIVGDDEHFNE